MKPIGTIYADDNGEAVIRWRSQFTIEDAIYRADVLQDLLHEMTQQYNASVDLMSHTLEALQSTDAAAIRERGKP